MNSSAALLRSAAAVLALAALSACASFRSYDAELSRTLDLAASGHVGEAITALEKHSGRKKRDLLHYFELGELLRLENRFDDSQKAWMAADLQVQGWEQAARLNPAKLLGDSAALIINDKLRPYEGRDFEKVMLTTRIALNHLARGDWDNARVEIKKTHEREAVIAELRARQIEKTEEEARKRGAGIRFKELNGYPVQTIDNPEVNALRNSYQSAFSHYLAGFVYEALGEPGLAAAGYRQAIELRPGLPLLEEALAGLDARAGTAHHGFTDVLFVIESGAAPARVSQEFNLPIPYRNELLLVPVSFPVLREQGRAHMPAAIRVGEVTATPAVITSVDAMARRALQEEMPGIMLRGMIRSTGKAALQHQAHRRDESALAAFAVAIGSILTESADERGWRTLPAQIAVARALIPSGSSVVEIDTPTGMRRAQISVAGRYGVIGLRFLEGRMFVIPDGKPPEGTPMRRTQETSAFRWLYGSTEGLP